jgi:hypothetical protein
MLVSPFLASPFYEARYALRGSSVSSAPVFNNTGASMMNNPSYAPMATFAHGLQIYYQYVFDSNVEEVAAA